MSSRAFILSPRLSDLASISASSSENAFQPSNVFNRLPSHYWQATNPVAYLDGAFPSFTEVDTLTFGYANSVLSDNFRLRLSSNPISNEKGAIPPEYDSEFISMWPTGSDLSPFLFPHRVFTFPLATIKYFRVDFSFTSNPRISRLIIGKRIEPAVSVETGWSIGGNEDVIETVSCGGEESVRAIGTKRSKNFTWHHIGESERESIYTLLLERGSAKDVVVAIEPMEGANSMSRVHLGRIKEKFTIKQKHGIPPNQFFGLSLTVSELGPCYMRA